MIQFTQTNLNPGNCWQTAIACILEVDPETMPPQHEIEALRAEKAVSGWGSYHNALNGYLTKHHGLVYSEIYRHQFGSVRPLREWHTLNGPTVRTSELKESGNFHVNHCVVARNREFVWDVHPSRAGLVRVESWGVIGEKQPSDPERAKKMLEDEAYALVFGCLCPIHNLNELRCRVAALNLESTT